MSSQTDTRRFPTVEGLDKLLGIPPAAEKERAVGAGTPNGSGIKASSENACVQFSAGEAFSQVSLPWVMLNKAPQWVSWREEDRKGRTTKIPHRPSGGGLAKSDDPAGWGTRAAAQSHAGRIVNGESKGGVGLMLGAFTGPVPVRLGGVDLDSCLDPETGALEPWAAEVIARFGSYAEVSPSGRGVKVFFHYSPADLPEIRALMGTDHGKSWSRGNHCEIALHVGNRYFAVTGERIADAPEDLRPVELETLRWLIEEAGPRFKGEALKADRSAELFALAARVKASGGTLEELRRALPDHPDAQAHVDAQGDAGKQGRALRRAWDRAPSPVDAQSAFDETPDEEQGEPTQVRARVAALNRTHALLRHADKVRIMIERPDGGLSLLSLGDFHAEMTNDRLAIDGKRVPVSQLWLASPARRTYRGGIVFRPSGNAPGDTFNVWHGWAVEPDPFASCDRFLAHLRDIICGGDEGHCQWLLAWMAHLVQRPEDKPGTAVVLRGPKGAGKDTVGRYLGSLFPQNHVTVAQPEHLTGRFNAHMERALLLHLEEGFWAGDHKAEGILKNLITCASLQIERKGLDPVEMPNFSRLLITSNAEWVVPATPGERRFFVLAVSGERARDTTYFAAIDEERRNGGAAALLHLLQSFDLSGFDVRNPPETAALQAQKLAGLRNVEAWWADVLTSGILPGPGGFDDDEAPDWATTPQAVSTGALRSAYVAWMQDYRFHGEVMGDREFGKALQRLCPVADRRRLAEGSSRPWGYTFPALGACRDAFSRLMGGAIEWPYV